MTDIAIVDAFTLNGKTLMVECPYCKRHHYHVMRASPYEDIRSSNCQQRTRVAPWPSQTRR